ncbi:MAG: DUF4440 domain-containing protein [Acidimicrobiia bacterium]|nr:DUF4440 domain-containing protein [Acidimicrobiia bacterium]
MAKSLEIETEPDEAATVAALDIEYQAAVEANDSEVMGRILAEDMVLITGRGAVVTREELLEEAQSGVTEYEHQYATDRVVRLWGETAVVTALLSAKGTTNGTPFEYRVWYSDTYVRDEHGWQYVLGQASTRLIDGR